MPLRLVFPLLALVLAGPAAFADEQAEHDPRVARLRTLTAIENHWGPAWQPLYHAALPWYERWGGNPRHEVDDWMIPPETYADELAAALEQGRNFFEENRQALIPIALTLRLADGTAAEINTWITLPAEFPREGRRFPLVISLHGTGWIGHKLSFVRQPGKTDPNASLFTVTPINDTRPWRIDLLNAFLDELLRRFPIDPDHVYVEGHSMGAMATWEWALENPERFAAISPRSGRGEPYRASRLRRVPSWVIHGADDDDVPSAFSDQMVGALEDCGAPVRYSVLPGVGHNMPADLDQAQVVAWYLRQTRSHEPVPPDPRQQLGLGPEGFSPWEVVNTSAAVGWKSEILPLANLDAIFEAAKQLFDRVHARGQRVDAPAVLCLDPKAGQASVWLNAPKSLHAAPDDAAPASLRAGRSLRFYFRGPTKDALAHLARVAAEAQAAGYRFHNDEIWVTPLSLWYDAPGYVAEYRVELD